MYISLVRSKIHMPRVTEANINYVGSIGIDSEYIQLAGLYPYEKVLVVDVENGARLETYIIPAPAGSREFSLNGAAARLVAVGDRLIIMAFSYYEPPPPDDYEPRILIMDADNAVAEIRGDIVDM